MTGPLVCAGQAVDDNFTPVGEPCGRRFAGVGRWLSVDERLQQARARGWSVAGPPMCPQCRRADPAIAKGLTGDALIDVQS